MRHTIISAAYEIRSSTPKTHQARVIDLDAGTVELLRDHRGRQQDDRDEWGADYQDGNLVFCHEDGTPLHPDTFSQSFERAVGKTTLPRIRLHDLRHTHATIALRAGAGEGHQQEVGPRDPAFTMKQHAQAYPAAGRSRRPDRLAGAR